nr:non-ribosomal peptide synthetase [uncultured Flavobacterium sp.]
MKFTLPQQDIYIDQLIHPNEPIYNIGGKIEIKGNLNIEIFNKAYTELIKQHDAMRIIIAGDPENISNTILDENTSKLGLVDFSHSKNPFEEATLYMQKEFITPFALFDGNPLHIFTLVKVTDNYHYLLSIYHHIIIDGWGISLMFMRLVQNYNEIFEFGNVRTIYPFSYNCFIEDDASYQNSDSFSEDRLYWRQKFQFLPENLLEKIDDTIKINKSSRKELIIKREVYNQLNTLALEYKCSTFNLILGILYTYFGRKHQNNDFAIGLPVLNRNKSKFKKTAGLFMGVSPLRIAFDFDYSLKDLITNIKNQLRDDYRHQRFPLGKLIQDLEVFTEKQRLFNITLSYEKHNYTANFQNTETKVIPLTHESEQVALAIYIREFDESEDVKIDFDYNLNYFDALRISETVNHFENLIKVILVTPNKKLKEFDYLTKSERDRLLTTFNDTYVDYPKEKTLIDLFDEQAEKTPLKEAVKDDFQSYSYFEINKLSNQIGQYLIATYGERDISPIAVLLGRSANMIAVLLGILKSGRPYIPLDPTFPNERLSYIINNSRSKIIISEKKYELDGVEDVEIVALENILEGINAFEDRRSNKILPKDTAYIIYTSGSTGNPKGVEIRHQSLLNFLTSIQKKPGIKTGDIFFSVTTYSFDISILEFFTPLLSGATLYIANQEILADPSNIIQKLKEIQPTLIQATPSFYQMLFNAGWLGDKGLKILCGGDLLSEALAVKLIDYNLEVWNMYGPTETTIWSSIKRIEHPKDASNIGKPIDNTQFYILDSFLSPKPIGTSGAIYIAGDGLASGYYRNETLTKEKFIKNPFNETVLIYETGDVGKWNEDGEIKFLGRNDNQVKIRGYRIELGDIESVILQFSKTLKEVVVEAKKVNQEKVLVAYLISTSDINELGLRNFLVKKLPGYMIPNFYVKLDSLPLTPNGKINRKELPDIESKDILKNEYVKPRNEIEHHLIKIWQEVLFIERIGTADSFFELGGHSLKASVIIHRILVELKIVVKLVDFFNNPTINSLTNFILLNNMTNDLVLSTSSKTDISDLATPPQMRMYFLQNLDQKSTAYNMPVFYNIKGQINFEKFKKALEKTIYQHEILRTYFIIEDTILKQFSTSSSNVNIEYYSIFDDESENKILDSFIRPFNLNEYPLFRVAIVNKGDNNYLILLDFHHILIDIISAEIIFEDFISHYTEEKTIKSAVTYKDAIKEVFFLEHNKERLFWKKYLKEYQRKEFPLDYKRESKGRFNGKKYEFDLENEIIGEIKRKSAELDVSLFQILISMISIWMSKIQKTDEIFLGVPVSGRDKIPEKRVAGLFVNTLPLKISVNAFNSVAEQINNVKNNVLTVLEHQNLQFDEILDEIKYKRELNRNPIFDVLVSYQNCDNSNIEKRFETEIEKINTENNSSILDLSISVIENNDSIKLAFEYNDFLLKLTTVEYLSNDLIHVINESCKNPKLLISDITVGEYNNKDNVTPQKTERNKSKPKNADDRENNIENESLQLIWSKILGGLNFNDNDDFFDIGGDSLKALILLNRVNKVFNVDINLNTFIENPTFEALSDMVNSSKKNKTTESLYSPIYNFRNNNKSNKFFLVHDVSGDTNAYNSLVPYLSSDFDVYGLNFYEKPKKYPTNITVEKIAKKYVDAILAMVSDSNNIYIAGWSAGAIIAFEITRQLEKINRNVEKLILIDAGLSNIKEEKRFTKEAETKWIENHLMMNDFENDLMIPYMNLEEMWLYFINNLKIKNDVLGVVKNKLKLKMSGLPFIDINEDLDTLFSKINLMRTINLSVDNYKNDKKINAETIIVKGSNSDIDINIKKWYTIIDKIKFDEIEADHFSILKHKDMIKLIKKI